MRPGAVDGGDPAQAPEHVRDVRSEDPPVDMRFVDDDEPQVGEEVSPAVMVRQDADVDHVGVGEDDVRGAPDVAPVLEGRVAVVDRRPQPGQRERAQRPELVLRERLGRIEVQRAHLRVSRHGVEDREVECERLTGRRAGRDADVLRPGRRVPRRALVGVQAVDADCSTDGRRERAGHAGVRPVAFGLRSEVGELLALKEPVEGR